VAVPTIGIGGSPACDGQILVIDDMLSLFTEFTPKFVKRYRRLGEHAADVRDLSRLQRLARRPPERPQGGRPGGCRTDPGRGSSFAEQVGSGASGL
jgi:3-methyl-2-oxobutanoate hydroxymethyltransferase